MRNEQLRIAMQLGQEAARLKQPGFIFGQEMASRVSIEQRVEQDSPVVEAVQQFVGIRGHAATMLARR